jgi:hypothetical protein
MPLALRGNLAGIGTHNDRRALRIHRDVAKKNVLDRMDEPHPIRRVVSGEY